MHMFRHAFALFVALTILLSGLLPSAPVRSSAASANAIDEEGVTLGWDLSLLEGAAGQTALDRIETAGFDTLQRPGLPEVPYTSTLIALPTGAQPTLEILTADTRRERLAEQPALALAAGSVIRDTEGEIVGGAYDAAPVAGLEGAATTAMALAPVVIEPVGTLRGVQLARLVFYPVVPEGNTAQITSAIRVRVHYNAPIGARAQVIADDPLSATLSAAIANPEILQAIAAPAASAASADGALATAPSALIDVEAAGLTSVTYEALTAAGFALTGVDPARLQLTRAGVATPMRWEGDGDTAFEPGERLLFYADPRFNRYTARDVYTLSVAGSSVTRMGTRPGLQTVAPPTGVVTTTQLFEQNSIYMPLTCSCGPLPAGRDGDRWAWEDLRDLGRSTVNIGFALSGVQTTAPASLRAWMISFTSLAANPDHRVALSVNGTGLGTFEWDGRQSVTQTLTIPAGVLINGNNTLTISLPGIANASPEGVWLDAFDVSYATTGGAQSAVVTAEGGGGRRNTATLSTSSGGIGVYDITAPGAPVFLDSPTVNGSSVTFDSTAGGQRFAVVAGAAIRAPAAVRLPVALSGATGATYVIISHPDFLSSVGGLRDLRAGQGLSVAVENVQAIYDAYDGGRATADAIAAFIADAYATWSPRPAYVVLVGDGTYDPRRYRAGSTPTYIPALLAVVDPWLGETATDNRYATVDGSDHLPDLAIGRLPVNSLAEAQTVIGKILAYEQTPPPGFWSANSLFVADNADGAGNFPVAAETTIQNHLNPVLAPARVYFNPAPTNALTETRQIISTTFNRGMGLLVYNGHASMRQWAGERLLHMDDANLLTNGGQLPIVLSMTCFTGSFHDSGLSTLDESLVRRSGGGAIGAWGPTGLGIASGHDTLSAGFLERVYVDRQPVVGGAILAGKLDLANRGQFLDLLDTFTWLGDPALRVNLGAPSTTLNLPVIRR